MCGGGAHRCRGPRTTGDFFAKEKEQVPSGGDLFDGGVEFDAAVRDPARPDRLRPEYDDVDHLHPSAAGHRALAEAIDLRLLDAGR